MVDFFGGCADFRGWRVYGFSSLYEIVVFPVLGHVCPAGVLVQV